MNAKKKDLFCAKYHEVDEHALIVYAHIYAYVLVTLGENFPCGVPSKVQRLTLYDTRDPIMDCDKTGHDDLPEIKILRKGVKRDTKYSDKDFQVREIRHLSLR